MVCRLTPDSLSEKRTWMSGLIDVFSLAWGLTNSIWGEFRSLGVGVILGDSMGMMLPRLGLVVGVGIDVGVVLSSSAEGDAVGVIVGVIVGIMMGQVGLGMTGVGEPVMVGARLKLIEEVLEFPAKSLAFTSRVFA